MSKFLLSLGKAGVIGVINRFHELVCQERRYVQSVSVLNSEGDFPVKGFLGCMVMDLSQVLGGLQPKGSRRISAI